MSLVIVCLIDLEVYFENYPIVQVLIGKVMSKVSWPKDNLLQLNEAKTLVIILPLLPSNQPVHQLLAVEIIGVCTIMSVVILLQQ